MSVPRYLFFHYFYSTKEELDSLILLSFSLLTYIASDKLLSKEPTSYIHLGKILILYMCKILQNVLGHGVLMLILYNNHDIYLGVYIIKFKQFTID